MSELINNKQKKIEIMKTLVRKLHEGDSEQKVKSQLETLLKDVDYADVFMMETQLIDEGIPENNIASLCDLHTNVLKTHLDKQEDLTSIPGHPVHTFIEENRALTETSTSIRKLVKAIEETDDDENVLAQMRQIQTHLNELMDVDKHYRRKEYLLFPYFEKKDATGPPAVMWVKHDEVREYLKLTINGLQNIDSIMASEAKSYNLFSVEPAVTAIEDMIYKEEKILFPMSLDLLEEAEWYEIDTQSAEFGYCLYVPEQKWTPSAEVDLEKSKAKPFTGKIQLPTGSFTLEELTAVFQTLPLDLTFVDKDDNVRFFSDNKDRVFDRTIAILGRKVQYCHPPTSVNVVDRIINDFRTKKQNSARFWIKMNDKLIYIVYHAVRDENEEYLGTLEVTQDLTEVRQLEGEQRLLDYNNN